MDFDGIEELGAANDDTDSPGLCDRAWRLLNERPANWNLTLNNGAEILDRLGFPKCAPNIMATAVTAIANAASTAFFGPHVWTHYSRADGYYAEHRRYYRPSISRNTVITAVGELERLELLEHDQTPQRPKLLYRSRFRANDRLLYALEDLRADHFDYVEAETIVLRSGGRALRYEDTRQTVFWRRDVAAQNAMIRNAHHPGRSGRHPRQERIYPHWQIDHQPEAMVTATRVHR